MTIDVLRPLEVNVAQVYKNCGDLAGKIGAKVIDPKIDYYD